MSELEMHEPVRKQIAAFLPDAIIRALVSYREFTGSNAEPEDCKNFAENHKACKAAIAHIELLIKLARTIQPPDSVADNQHKQIALAAIVKEAEEELNAYKSKKIDTKK